jgi:hypothetical protein
MAYIKGIVRVPPLHANAGGPYSGDEGAPVALSGSASGGSATYTYSWSWAATNAPAGASCSFDNVAAQNPNLTCNDNGTYRVTLTVNDGTRTAPDTTAVTVGNAAPTITRFAADRSSALTRANVTFTGQATDPSSNDLAAGLKWAFAINGATYSAFRSSNQLTASFSTCGSHTVSAEAQDKDGGTSTPTTANTVTSYDGAWQPPLYDGKHNVVTAGRVIPVKIGVSCNNTYLTTLAPTIQLIQGDVDSMTDSQTTPITTTSASAANTTGMMRLASPYYIYNLQVPTGYRSGTLFTIRVRPFGDGDPLDSMYVLIKTR